MLTLPRAALKKGIGLLKSRLPTAQHTGRALEPIYAHLPQQNAHVHPTLRQKIAGRWYSTTASLSHAASHGAAPRAARPASIPAHLGRITTSAPFASTLRPKLVGGAFPRTAGGYSLGGGARYFSHGPAAPAQVMQQVSQAMRAFVQGSKNQLESYRPYDKRASVRAQLAASLASQQGAPGSYVDFDLSPTFTALSPLTSPAKTTLENTEFVHGLAADFGSMIGGLTAVYADLKRLSVLGDLPVTLVGARADVLRVHFRGCDRDFVERLCDEVGVLRGVVHEDERFAFDLLAPGIATAVPAWCQMMSDSPPESTEYSEDGFDSDYESGSEADPSLLQSRISGSDGLLDDYGESYYFDVGAVQVSSRPESEESRSLERSFEGLEGVHRFLGECDEYRNGLSAWSSA